MTHQHPPREPRYKALAFMSFGCVITGIGYLPLTPLPERSAGLSVATGVLPLSLLGALWLLVGLWGFLTVYRRKPGHGVFSIQFGLFMLWALSYWAAWLGWLFNVPGFDIAARAYVVAGWMTMCAGAVAYMTRVEPPLWQAREWWKSIRRRLPW